MILSVGDRQLFFFIGGRPEWSGPRTRLGKIIVLFFRKLQLELRRAFAPHTVFQVLCMASQTE
ncbi:hypothetical protein A6U88_05590 [Agrobacterium sp. B131/95]|nr:hypothetical protein A6U88_05590 [Agrobacterium sp. B131/95]